MPAIRRITATAAAVIIAVLLESHSAHATPTTSPPAALDTTPTGFYWPWQSWTQPWATVIAGGAVLIAALITLIIAWLTRRKTDRHWTATKRQQRFIEAARQLADANPAVRIAGIAAMETLTDDWLTPNPLRRLLHLSPRRARQLQAQQCVNVLTAYLRIPATPPPDNNPTIREEHITTTRGRGSLRDKGNTVERHHHYTVNDDEVRATITRTIAAHLRTNPTGRTWSTLTYDFTTAHFHNANFTDALWTHPPRFTDAVLTGETQFLRARFEFGAVFDRATFDDHARFDRAIFGGTRFGAQASFDGATFGYDARFDGATFNAQASFDGATFDDHARFDRAIFGDQASFNGATFGDQPHFGWAEFGDHARFDGATFGDQAKFHRARFGHGARFDGATFGADPPYRPRGVASDHWPLPDDAPPTNETD